MTSDVLDPAEAIAAVAAPDAGAVQLFLGVVRNHNKSREVSYLEYEAYPAMAEREMLEIATAAAERFSLKNCAVLHRTGRLEIGEASLVVALSSAHRGESFDAGRWMVDEIKRRVPVWKKEVWSNGESWVEGPESLGLSGATGTGER